jgi:hypothetical protein
MKRCIHDWTTPNIKGRHTLPGEPKGEWVPDSDDEPEGFLGASLVFWDMKRVKILPRKSITFQQNAHVRRNTIESPLSEEGKAISRSYKQPEPKGRKLQVLKLAAFKSEFLPSTRCSPSTVRKARKS